VNLDGVMLAGRADFAGKFVSQAVVSGASLASFRNRTEGKIRDFRVEGVAPWPIRGEESRLDFSVEGSASEAGFPENWRNLTLVVQSSGASGRLELKTSEGPTSVVLLVEAPWKIGDASRKASIQVGGNWSEEPRHRSVPDWPRRNGAAARRFADPPGVPRKARPPIRRAGPQRFAGGCFLRMVARCRRASDPGNRSGTRFASDRRRPNRRPGDHRSLDGRRDRSQAPRT
jgi:hypothetical protein